LDESIHLMLVLSLLLHSPEEWQKHRREFLQRGFHFAYNQTRQSRPLMPVPPSPSPGGSLTDLSSLFTGGPLVVDTQGGGFDAPAAFKAVKPVAILVALADKLQRFFKKAGKGGGGSWAAFSETPSGPGRVVDEEELSFSFSRGSPRPGTPISGGGEGSPLRRGGDSGPQKSPSRRPSSEDSGDHSWELVMKEKLRDIPAMLVFAKEFQEVVEDLHAAEDLVELLDIVDCLGDIYDPAGGGSWEEFLEQSATGSTPRASSVS
jgi:E3 ubiquitin-protein ligase UBR4